MRTTSFFIFCLFITSIPYAQPKSTWDEEKIDVKKGNQSNTILSASAIIAEGWSDLAQPKFWKQIMNLSPDSCIINIASSRVIIATMSIRDWKAQTEVQKGLYRDSVRLAHNLDSEARIF